MVIPGKTSGYHWGIRAAVFLLASTSFAGLLGEFYGLWMLRFFALWVMAPAAVVLAVVAWRSAEARVWVVHGVVGGIVSAVAYDLYRLPFVLSGAPLFDVFPLFGQMILGRDASAVAKQVVGWTYHFSNGAALGVMYLAMMPGRSRGGLFLGAVVWACAVEGLLLMTPYTEFFGLRYDGWFIFLTATAHLVFGIALGVWCAGWLGKPAVGRA